MQDNSISIWNSVANEMISNDLHEDALYYFNKILEIDHFNHEAVENKAYILDILGRSEEAIECVSSYLKHDSSNLYIWILKGDLLDVHHNNKVGALECFNRALTIDDRNEEAWTKKAYALKEMGSYAEAAECFGKVMRLMDDSPSITGYPLKYKENDQECYREISEEYNECLELMDH